MKKLLLMVLVASGLAFVPVQSSDAQIYVGIPGIAGVGIGGGYYGYPAYSYSGYYPYGYYRPYYYSRPYYSSYYSGPSYYCTTGIEFTIATIAIIITTTAINTEIMM